MSHLPSSTPSSRTEWPINTTPRRRWAAIAGAGLATLLCAGAYYYFQPFSPSRAEYVAHTQNLTSNRCDNGECFVEMLDNAYMDDLGHGLRATFEAITVPFDTTEWYDSETGIQHNLTAEQRVWDKPLAREICIADIDTRSFDHNGQIFDDNFDWKKAGALSSGMLNHFVYASIHNYSHHVIQAKPWPNGDRKAVWTKIPQLKRLLELEQCRIVISLDSDAIFRHLELPMEFLLNKWNFTPETSMALPNDTGFYINSRGRVTGTIGNMLDTHGVININGGVVIAQDLPRTHEMIDAWISCPDDYERFPGCSRLRRGWPLEQGAFGSYVRYEYNHANDLLTIPCGDANGFPEQGMDCRGTFISHFTTVKTMTKDVVEYMIMDSLATLFTVHRNKGNKKKLASDAR